MLPLRPARLDGFFEFNLKPGYCRQFVIVKEAGGIVTDMSGDEGWLESGDIVYSQSKDIGANAGNISPTINKQL